MHIIQLVHPQFGRRVAIVEEPNLILLNKSIASSYQLLVEAINRTDRSVQQIIETAKTREVWTTIQFTFQGTIGGYFPLLIALTICVGLLAGKRRLCLGELTKLLTPH